MRKSYPDLKLFFFACGISLMGSLPPGTLNVSVTTLAFNKGIMAAVEFSIAAILIEMVMVRIAAFAVNKVAGLFFQLFGLLSAFIIIILGLTTFIASFHPQSAPIPLAGQQPFLSGLFLSLINPFHLPFWIGWTTVLKSKGILKDQYYLYITGIGFGTALAFIAYILAGSLLIQQLGKQQLIINRVLGCFLLAMGLWQFYKMFKPLRFSQKE